LCAAFLFVPKSSPKHDDNLAIRRSLVSEASERPNADELASFFADHRAPDRFCPAQIVKP
jgi:hypothetical protein